MVETSNNCKSYTDSISLFCNGKATLGKCTATLGGVMSCQTQNYETPDPTVRNELRQQAWKAFQDAGCDDVSLGIDAIVLEPRTNLVGTHQKDLSPEKLAELGMCSNCFSLGSDVNHSTHVSSAKCFAVGDVTNQNGHKVVAPHTSVKVSLRSCDITMDANAQVEEDLRKLAALRLSDKYKLTTRPDQLQCFFDHLPGI